MLKHLFKTLAPVAALAIGTLTAGCGEINVSLDNDDGVPLAELDLGGAAPTSLVLAGPDSVIVSQGDTLAVTVDGDADAQSAMRFSLDDDTLAIGRKDGSDIDGKATVRVTMPSLNAIVLAGSGTIAADTMADSADVTIAGTGRVDVKRIESDTLEATIAGSGTFASAGSVRTLDLNVMGSGSAELEKMQVERADVNVMGSGAGGFASDGTVEANIMGSGEVTVLGRASCEVKAMGSGKLNCRSAGGEAQEAQQ